MNKFYKAILAVLLVIGLLPAAMAQTTISGKVVDESGSPLPGVNIRIKGLTAGTITNADGEFSLTVNQDLPLTLEISSVGYATQTTEVTAATSNLEIKMAEQTSQLGELTVYGTRYPENFMKATNTVELQDIIAIQQTPAAEYYESLATVKGVNMTSSSLNFPQINTRGFATVANVRFVQMVDGIDTQAPLLNFPTGNIVGLGELDAESMELLPGAASALYGPNAFNGVLLMRSKSPFDYQGLSVQFKGGVTTSDAQGQAYPMINTSIRYAKAFNNKFAFKVNFSILDAEDWHSTDYKTDVNRSNDPINYTGTPNFDAVNLYGDETQIVFNIPTLPTIPNFDLRRTGWKEEDLIDNYDAKSLKADAAIHFRPTDKVEMLYNFRYGGGSSIYQGSQKYALRNFTQMFHKFEIRSNNWFVRAYVTETDAGDSYNMAALGGVLNERISPTASQWAPTYGQYYVLALQGYLPGVPAGDPAAAHQAARAAADGSRTALSPDALKSLINEVRNDYFQRDPAGAKFIDNSRLYHAEFNYNFRDVIKFAEIQVGGNVRRYSLFSDGTIFNEDPEEGTDFKRIDIDEFGLYTQIAKNIGDKLKLTGSVRYDKNENFDGRITPRFSAGYALSDHHNLRASFQTGFRNPDTQAQFIFFPVGTNTLLGSTKANAERYGIHEGGAWSKVSYDAFRASGGTLDPATGAPVGGNANLLVTDFVNYVKPERLQSFEIGYKGTFSNKLLIDANFYYSAYTDFIGGDDVVSKAPTTHQGNTIPAGTTFSPYRNSSEDVTSFGIGVGATYNLPKGYQIIGNYNYADFSSDQADGSTFRAGFNTPKNKFNIGFANRKVTKNFGFNINFRWQESFNWQSDFGDWIVPEFGVLDAQVSYRIPSIKTVLKLGGTNLGGGDYRTNLGGPFVGQTYYLSLTFDEFFK